MQQFFTTTIWGQLIFGALGSLLGYIVIILFNFLKKKLVIASNNFSEKRRVRNFKLFKERFIKGIVLNKVLDSEGYGIFFIISNLLINISINSVLILIFCVLTIMLLLNHNIVQKAPFLIFIVGLLSSYPSFKLGYNIGSFRRIFSEFLQKEMHKHNIAELEESATSAFKVMKNK